MARIAQIDLFPVGYPLKRDFKFFPSPDEERLGE